MVLLAVNAILPAWLVLPVAAVTMLVVAAHVLAVQTAEMPRLRRRIRTVNGLLMLFVTALLAYALGIAEQVGDPKVAPDRAREFVAIWMGIVALISVVVAMAGVDALHSFAASVAARRVLRRQLRDNLRSDLSGRRSAASARPPATARGDRASG